MVCLDSDFVIGSPDKNGSYDGLIGYVQRNETNLVYVSLTYQSFDFEPGFLVPNPVPNFVPHIYTARIKGNLVSFDVLHAATNFNNETWLYWSISLTLCSITILTIIHFKKRRKKFRLKRNIKRFLKCNWNYVMLILDMAPLEVSKKVACSIIWTIIVIAVYYGIHMVFWSTLSADLSAKSPDSWIDTLDDLLFDPKFAQHRAVIFDQYLTYPMLLKSEKNSKERKLLDRVINSGEIVHVNMKEESQMSIATLLGDYLNGTSNGTMIIVEDSNIEDMALSEVSCYLEPEKTKKIVKSKHPVFSYPTAMILSHDTPREVVELFTYRSLVGSETGQLKGAFARLYDLLREMNGIRPSINATICRETVLNILPKDHDQEWNPLPISFFFNFFLICSCILLIASAILYLEIVSNNISSVLESTDQNENIGNIGIQQQSNGRKLTSIEETKLMKLMMN